ncbi:hypothetical protein [Bradyrhizobium australiense]|uniref:Uncharacterized protein n=1 Tax=Bradyrhizobium australiense TaxID=2721161 RepID=A0A7Y4LYI1_9BRAD|nr:hypothetical protein [Bradyrhizobium australiense]NOJ43543.1 hypothetical protein [Bradyrhizobium australiense]
MDEDHGRAPCGRNLPIGFITDLGGTHRPNRRRILPRYWILRVSRSLGYPGSFREEFQISALSLLYLVILCLSLIVVSQDVSPAFHIGYDRQFAFAAALAVAAFGATVSLFSIARFTFGYLVSWYMLSIIAGYIWLSFFSPLDYDKSPARWSAALSLIAFMIPAMFVTKPFPLRLALTPRQIDHLVIGMMVLSAMTVGYASLFGFHLIGFIDGEAIRSQFGYPSWLNYPIGIAISAVLPFSYAWLLNRRLYALSVVALAIGVSFYPVTLNKFTLFAPAWLLFATLLLRFFGARLCVILSLLVPVSLGLLIKVFDPSWVSIPFRLINFRMIAIPSSAIDHYNHFFSTHQLTYLCQIQPVGKFFGCSLPQQLGVLFAEQYATGNYNASLFATEGIASVGPYLAPAATLACGLVISLGNKASAELDQKFVFLSGSILVQALMNVPLSTAMLSHGAALLFALWLITPREDKA